MITLEEARAHVLGRLPVPAEADIALPDALGLILAEDVVAPEAVPPFANSAVDGFAVQAADTLGASTAAPVELRVIGTQAAGAPPGAAVEPGTAVRIMTGAVVPPGADAMVMVEDTGPLDDGARVAVHAPTSEGRHVRLAGNSVAAGEVVLTAGTRLGPAHLGVLAEVGRGSVTCWRAPVVGVMSTGDELVDDGSPLAPGQIRESNRPMLLGLLAQAGCVGVDLGTVRDDEDAIEAAIVAGVESCDALLTSGGVSMGDFDYVKVVLDRLGDMAWMQIAIRPAKPFAFGTVGGVPVFGLPGNPVSSLVSFELLARPALRRMAGDPAPDRPTLPAVCPDGFPRRPDGKTHLVRARLQWDGASLVARSAGAQGSHQLAASAGAEGLAILPDGEGVEPGGSVRVLVMNLAGAFSPTRS